MPFSASNPSKNFFAESSAAMCFVVQPLVDALFRINARGNVEQALIGFSILDNKGGFSVYR